MERVVNHFSPEIIFFYCCFWEEWVRTTPLFVSICCNFTGFFLWVFSYSVLFPSSCTFYGNIDFLYYSVEKLACTFFPRAAIGHLWVKQHQKYNWKSSKEGGTQDAKRRVQESPGILRAMGLELSQKAYKKNENLL